MFWELSTIFRRSATGPPFRMLFLGDHAATSDVFLPFPGLASTPLIRLIEFAEKPMEHADVILFLGLRRIFQVVVFVR